MDNLIATGLIGISLGSQYALLALGFTLIFGILGVVNWASVQYGGKLDLTNAKRYTLADQTRKILGSLDRDVKIIAFFPSRLDGDPFSRGTTPNTYQAGKAVFSPATAFNPAASPKASLTKQAKRLSCKTNSKALPHNTTLKPVCRPPRKQAAP